MKTINCIKKYRAKKQLTQEQLAQKINLTLRALQSYERGERLPDVYTVQKIMKALNVEVGELFPAED